ncbi:MAG: CTP-dependent riboflavin kinase [Acidobacteria bacterium]|nr:CTP-dependent riboflavin kinase [Acidobacteriota bacterium]MCZ6751407.1 CTP-dependent riboflavin kinase [Acidobacteriota bacterium]
MPVQEAASGKLKIEGRLQSGIGRGAQFLGLEWVQKQLREKLGLAPFPGTLNLQVSPDACSAVYAQRRGFLKIDDPAAPGCPGYVKRVSLQCGGRSYRSAYLILPELTMYKDVLEIIAADNLREELNLKDGDKVQVEEILER